MCCNPAARAERLRLRDERRELRREYRDERRALRYHQRAVKYSPGMQSYVAVNQPVPSHLKPPLELEIKQAAGRSDLPPSYDSVMVSPNRGAYDRVHDLTAIPAQESPDTRASWQLVSPPAVPSNGKHFARWTEAQEACGRSGHDAGRRKYGIVGVLGGIAFFPWGLFWTTCDSHVDCTRCSARLCGRQRCSAINGRCLLPQGHARRVKH